MRADDRSRDVDVLIVGGGPAGLTTALSLGAQGIDFALVDRRASVGRYPRAHLLNVRTMEIFHDVGVADAIYAAGPENDRWRHVAWYTSLGGPTDLHGRRIGLIDAWGGGPDADRYATASPRRFANLPQSRLDKLLWDTADERHPGRLRASNELTGLTIVDDGVVASLHDRLDDVAYEVRARFVVAADGGRTCSELLGVTMEGARSLVDVVSVHMSADLSEIADQAALLTYFLSPGGAAPHRGALLSLSPRQHAADSPEWTVSTRFSLDDERSHDQDFVCERVRSMLGIPDLEMDVHAISHWQYEGVVADRFRVGPVFLAGDAAHRHPPTGGLGLNSAVQDAANLSWKLAMVLRGVANDSLLDTYESERLPVTAFNVDHSLRNAGRHAPIAEAMGLRVGQSEDEGWRQVALWAEESSIGERRRAATAEAVQENAEDYSQLNVEAGFSYEVGATVPDGSPHPGDPDSATEFVSTARPGHHVPHEWLTRSGRAVSTVDLVPADGFALFVFDDETWTSAAKSASTRCGVPVSVVNAATDRSAVDGVEPPPSWGVTTTGAVLVRPDKHVAWRSPTRPDDATGALVDALTTVLNPGRLLEVEVSRGSRLSSIAVAGERLRTTTTSRSTIFTVSHE